MDDPRRILWLVRIYGPIDANDIWAKDGKVPHWKVKVILEGLARDGLARRVDHAWTKWDVTERGRLLCPACPATAALLEVRYGDDDTAQCDAPRRRMADAARGLFGRGT